MRVVISRFGTPLLLLCLCTAVPRPATACDGKKGGDVKPVAISTLPTYETSRVREINNRGDIAGQVVRLSDEPTEQAVVWRKQHHHGFRVQELPPLDGLLRGDARGFATDEIPIGFSYSVGVSRRAVAWVRDRDTHQVAALDLEPSPGYTDAEAIAGNGLGVIVGDASNPKEVVNGFPVRHAMLWRIERDGDFFACDLGVPDGYSLSAATDVSRTGLVVGTASGRNSSGRVVTDVFVWRPVGWQHRHQCHYEAVAVPAVPDFTNHQSPTINDRGDIVATARSLAPAGVALYWQHKGGGYADPIALPLPAGFTDGAARGINSSGAVVGTAQQRDSKTGTIAQTVISVWTRKAHGWQVESLAVPANTTALSAESINDDGDVVADSVSPPAGSTGAWLWQRSPGRYLPWGEWPDGHGFGDERR